MIKIALVVAAMILFLVQSPAISPQERAVRDCRDDDGVDRCDEGQQRRVRQLFGLRSIEEHRDAGDRVRRVFYVDGYGNDVVAISFVRAPGRDPTVSIHYPQPRGEPRPEPLQAPVPQRFWNEVIEGGEHFHRDFVARPEPTSGSGETVYCMHSWVYTIEASDRPNEAQRSIRRKTEDACDDGPGEVYAQQLDRVALSLIPHCAALDVRQYRNAATALAACRILRGDRIAAAEALNRADAFTNVQGAEEARLIAELFDDDATIVWASEQHRRGAGADEFWAARVRTGEGLTNFFIHAVEGLNADRVRLTGSLFRAAAGADPDYEAAAVEQIWTRENGSEWLIEQATVGPWRREPST